MTKDLDKKNKSEIIRSQGSQDIENLNPVQNTSPFVSFHYSYREISSGGGQTYIKSRQRSFENGKFKSEEFEGTLPGNVYLSMVGEMQKIFFNQLSFLMKPFAMLLPFTSKDKEK